MANGIYRITEDFEKALGDYTGSPYVVTVDNASNAIFLALMYENVKGQTISIPSRTYPSVPCEIIHAGAKIQFDYILADDLSGYQVTDRKTVKTGVSDHLPLRIELVRTHK